MGTVCYVNSAVGLNVRDDAAGNVIAHLNNRDLMKVISAVPIQRALSGHVYWWNYVYYYKSPHTEEEGYGWVAEQYTTEVSSTIPTVYDVISNNLWLNQYQSLINARYIFNYLRNHGCSVNSIYGMLGNMENESSVNPGKWEVYDNETRGYGLVQWTPASDYFEWVENEEDRGKINKQLEKILDELVHPDRWLANN